MIERDDPYMSEITFRVLMLFIGAAILTLLVTGLVTKMQVEQWNEQINDAPPVENTVPCTITDIIIAVQNQDAWPCDMYFTDTVVIERENEREG